MTEESDFYKYRPNLTEVTVIDAALKYMAVVMTYSVSMARERP